ncbi:hypothetical protein PAXINDRAFT_97721 [Paxillus involutus ATCC 200175]|nr:hypothetical protein PAXINDRAFT_97721 [Paxillus involutus ATCC 200175]
MVEFLAIKLSPRFETPRTSPTSPPNIPLPNSSSLVRLLGESTFVVFNNAGQIVVGEVDAHKPFDVNFWGAANITKEAVRFFRDVNSPAGGRLL